MTPRIPAPRLAALLLVTLLFPIGCTSETASVPAEKKAEALRVAVIPKGTTHEFWKSIHAGAIQAERELEGIEIVWQGPQREDDRAQQLALVENFTATGIDAIVLAPLDDRALVAPCQQAMGMGIPVVVIDSGLQGEMGKDFAAYVATDNYRGGQLAGENLGRILEGRGKVLLLRYDEGSASTEQREEGFVEAIRKFPGITLIDPERYAGATRRTSSSPGATTASSARTSPRPSGCSSPCGRGRWRARCGSSASTRARGCSMPSGSDRSTASSSRTR
jgi:ribose transport system substrate-binding protein